MAALSGQAVAVTGLNELTRSLRVFEEALPAAVRVLNRTAAESVVPIAKTFAAQMFEDPSGALAGTIKAGATQRTGYIKAGSKAVPYAGVQQFGWPAHDIEAHPFLEDALGQAEPAIVEEYQHGLGALLTRLDIVVTHG